MRSSLVSYNYYYYYTVICCSVLHISSTVRQGIFDGYKFSWFSRLPSNPRKTKYCTAHPFINYYSQLLHAKYGLLSSLSQVSTSPSSLSKSPCKCGTLKLVMEMRNQYMEYCICFTVRTGESTKFNSTKITNLSYFWNPLENSLPYSTSSTS